MTEEFYSRILVALDGSELAERVLPHVEALAIRFRSRIILVRVTDSEEMLLASMASSPGALGAVPAMVDPGPPAEAEREEACLYLDSIVRRLGRRGLAVHALQTEGKPAPTIVKLAHRLRADLIAIASHGRGGLSRLFLGSVADEVQWTAPCPVLQVRANDDLLYESQSVARENDVARIVAPKRHAAVAS